MEEMMFNYDDHPQHFTWNILMMYSVHLDKT